MASSSFYPDIDFIRMDYMLQTHTYMAIRNVTKRHDHVSHIFTDSVTSVTLSHGDIVFAR